MTSLGAAEFSLIIGALLLVFHAALLLSITAGLAIRTSTAPFHLAIATVMAVAFLWHVTRSPDLAVDPSRLRLVALTTALAVVLLAVVVSGSFYDLSWDGQTRSSRHRRSSHVSKTPHRPCARGIASPSSSFRSPPPRRS